MATIAMYHNVTYEPRRMNWTPLLMVVLFAAVLLCAHAVVRHGADAERVRQCMNDKGAIAHLVNPATGRHYLICEIEEGLFGIQVLLKDGWQWKEVTAFTKGKMHTLEQVLKYLHNGGAW